MSESNDDPSSTSDSTPPSDPAPVESGSKSVQHEASSGPVAGEIVPRAQLSRVADCVSTEVSGLVESDPTALGGVGALRAIASYLNEQAATLSALRKDAEDSRERDRKSTAEAAELRAQLAVANNVSESERRLRTPRAVLTAIGIAIGSFGVEQFANGSKSLGVVLVLAGLAVAVIAYFLAPADGGKS